MAREARKQDEALPLVACLREAVRGCGLSLNELGRRAGVSEGQLSRFLRGDRTLTLPAAARLCLFLGLELRPRAASGRDGENGEGPSQGG